MPDADSAMPLLKPPLMVVVMVEVPKPFWPMVSEDGVAEIVKLPVAAAGKAHNSSVTSERKRTRFLFRMTKLKTPTPKNVMEVCVRLVGQAYHFFGPFQLHKVFPARGQQLSLAFEN
jgi:hypothetical protein